MSSRVKYSIVGTPMLERVLEAWMLQRGTRDLGNLCESAQNKLSWNTTSPDPTVMAAYADVAEKVALRASNLTVGHPVMVAALLGCHGSRRGECLASGRSSGHAEELGGVLRCVLTRFRNLKKYPDRLDNFQKKAQRHAAFYKKNPMCFRTL